MLNKKRTAGWARLRLLLALPLGGAMLCTSTMAFTKDYGYLDLLPEKSFSKTLQEVPKVENIKKQTAPKVENVKRDQVKFLPPVVKKNVTFFATRDFKISSTHPPYVDKRYILFNGKHVSDTSFWAVFNATSVKHINASEAISKYGEVARNGAVEIAGGNIKYIKPGDVVPPPPVEPPPPSYRANKNDIKFPPPVVKPDGKNLKNPPPVEPPPPGYRTKKDQIKFPPPVVKPIEKKTPSKMIEGDPIKKPEVIEVVITGDPINQTGNN